MTRIGTIVNNRYRIDRIIGTGGTSIVYLGYDLRLQTRWAVKELKKRDGLSVELAEREIDMLKSIDYKMFPRIVDAWQDGQSLFLVCDYVEGESLDKILSDGKVHRRQAYKWAVQILEGLIYLHGLSPPILYLDLKPENIIVCSDGRIKMIDFGIAGRITDQLLQMGTPGFAAPEQYGKDYSLFTGATDIFAFGMTYCYIRSGHPPDESLYNQRERIKHSKDLSHKEKAFLNKCTAEIGADRFQSADEAYRQLKQINLSPFYKRKIIGYLSFIIIALFGLFIAYQKNTMRKNEAESARTMIREAGKYISDGEYTKEGIKVIETFIKSGCLDDEAVSQFKYEVARNCFIVQHDYKKAYIYFNELDEKDYPEVKYYLELCRIQSDFEYDEDELLDCIGRFYGSTKGTPVSKRKMDALMMISSVYANYDSNKSEGLKKAITVLEAGLDEAVCEQKALKYESAGGNQIGQMDELEIVKEKYEERLEILYSLAKRAN